MALWAISLLICLFVFLTQNCRCLDLHQTFTLKCLTSTFRALLQIFSCFFDCECRMEIFKFTCNRVLVLLSFESTDRRCQTGFFVTNFSRTVNFSQHVLKNYCFCTNVKCFAGINFFRWGILSVITMINLTLSQTRRYWFNLWRFSWACVPKNPIQGTCLFVQVVFIICAKTIFLASWSAFLTLIWKILRVSI